MQTVEARPARPAAAPSGGELAGILRDCAEWVPGSLERLKAYYAARLRVRVGPALADAALAEPSLQSALADAWAEAGEFDPSRESAEQWLFERVRQARGSFLRKASHPPEPRAEVRAPVVEPPRPAPVPPPARVPAPEATPAPKPAAREVIEPPPAPQPVVVPVTPARADQDDAEPGEDQLDPSRVTARRPARLGGPATARAPAATEPPRRRTLHRVVLSSLAILLGIVGAVIGSEWLRAPVPAGGPLPVSRQTAAAMADVARPAPPPPADVAAQPIPPPSPTVASPSPLPPPEAPEAVRPKAPEQATRVPPPVPSEADVATAPVDAAPADQQPDQVALPPRVRVFVHYGTGNPADEMRARWLAGELERQGFEIAAVRMVPFRIGNGGVRYFFPDDRKEAARLQVTCLALLEQDPRLRQRGPLDFTRYQPRPTPGTLEFWLPST